jgi:hypothetical protein
MTNIDVTDFEEALAADRDGSFHVAVESHLAQAAAEQHALIQRGLAPAEFTDAAKVEAALAKAIDVIRFSRSLHVSK